MSHDSTCIKMLNQDMLFSMNIILQQVSSSVKQSIRTAEQGLFQHVDTIVFLWYLLFSVDNSRTLKSVDFAGEVFHPKKNGPKVWEGFVVSNVKTRFLSQLITEERHNNENPCKVC